MAADYKVIFVKTYGMSAADIQEFITPKFLKNWPAKDFRLCLDTDIQSDAIRTVAHATVQLCQAVAARTLRFPTDDVGSTFWSADNNKIPAEVTQSLIELHVTGEALKTLMKSCDSGEICK